MKRSCYLVSQKKKIGVIIYQGLTIAHEPCPFARENVITDPRQSVK